MPSDGKSYGSIDLSLELLDLSTQLKFSNSRVSPQVPKSSVLELSRLKSTWLCLPAPPMEADNTVQTYLNGTSRFRGCIPSHTRLTGQGNAVAIIPKSQASVSRAVETSSHS